MANKEESKVVTPAKTGKPRTMKTPAQKKAEADAKAKKAQEKAEQERLKAEQEEAKKQEEEETKAAEQLPPPVKPENNENELTDDEFDQGHRDGHLPESEEDGEGQLKLGDDGHLSTDKEDADHTENSDGNNVSEEEVSKFYRKTKIKKTTSTVTIKALYREWKKDQEIINARELERKETEEKGIKWEPSGDETTLRFDLAIQRNAAWNLYQKSDLIHSVLYGYYIPPVLVQDSNDNKKWFLDGKQRVTSLMEFIAGMWALSKKTKPVYGFNIAGCKFQDLPDEMQEEILDETLTMVEMKNMTVQERDEMFLKQNSGSPLSKIEMIRAMYSDLIEPMDKVLNFRFFKDDIELSKGAKDKFVDVEILLQTLMLFEEGKEGIKGFSSSHIEKYVLKLKEENRTISDDMMYKMETLCDYLTLAFEDFEMPEIKKALKKVHVPMIFWNADKAMEHKVQPNVFGEFIRSFLVTNYSVDSAYGKTAQSSVPKKDFVIMRINEMNKYMNNLIETIKQAEGIDKGFEIFNEYLAKENSITANSRQEASA